LRAASSRTWRSRTRPFPRSNRFPFLDLHLPLPRGRVTLECSISLKMLADAVLWGIITLGWIHRPELEL
jgi:hypothetical protein